MKNVPPSWDRMSRFARACYLVNCKRAKDIPTAMKMLGLVNPAAQPRPRKARSPSDDIRGRRGVIYWYREE